MLSCLPGCELPSPLMLVSVEAACTATPVQLYKAHTGRLLDHPQCLCCLNSSRFTAIQTCV